MASLSATPLWRNGTLDSYWPKHFQSGLLRNLEYLRDNGHLNVWDKPSTSSVPNSGRTIPRFWDSKIPSKKRSSMVYERIIAPIEKFLYRIYNLWRLHGNPDEPEEEVLLLHDLTSNFIPSNEIGLGAMLLKPDDAPNKKG